MANEINWSIEKTDKMVEIGIEEYIKYRLKEADLKRLVDCIVNNTRLTYNGESLTTDGEEVMNTIKTLFPNTWAEIYEAKKKERHNGPT